MGQCTGRQWDLRRRQAEERLGVRAEDQPPLPPILSSEGWNYNMGATLRRAPFPTVSS